MDTTPIVGRLSVIANAVKALRSLQNLQHELAVFEIFAQYVGEYLTQKNS